MQNSPFKNIGIPDILKISSIFSESNLGQDFILGEADGKTALTDNRILEILQSPIRLDGYILFFLKKGRFKIDFNLHSYQVQEGSLLVSVPGNIIHISSLDEDRLLGIEIVFVVLSKEFISGLHLDFNSAFQQSMQMLEDPCILLNEEQLSLAESYFRLARKVIESSYKNKRQIVAGLLTSLSYLADDVWTEQLKRSAERQPSNNSRAYYVYEKFMKLVTEYHTSERNMQFYADKMSLTPKYLSKVIKDVSGRGGPEWIDDYVVLEAKNLLRYSEEPIKEIVYKLNFPSVSVFHKFFKQHTGMTPSEYRHPNPSSSGSDDSIAN